MVNITKELVQFWRKFGKMLDSGMPALHALDLIRQETGDKLLQAMIDDVRAAIKAGKTLGEAIAKYPSYFSPTIQGLIKAGETGGILNKVMSKIAEGLEDGTFEVGEKIAPKKKKSREKDAEPLRKEPKGADDADAVKVTSSIIRDAVNDGASDIHLEWLSGGLRVRCRIDGVLKEVEPPPKELQEAVISRIKIMSDLDVAERRLPQHGRIRLNVDGKEIDLRVCTAPSITGESIVVRVLSRSAPLFDLDKEGFADSDLEKVRAWSRRANGLIIVTGPTGCGKTTTLYSLLQEMNTVDRKIVTSEDPVEYQMDGISQMQINPRIGLTFAQAIRCQLRQAPNVIMVGEIRDLETAEVIIQAALTGHLVFTTLHTNDAVGAIRRMLDIGVEPFLVNGALIGVLAQRLVRVICENCREEHAPEEWLRKHLEGCGDATFFRGKGCEKCHNTGYRGRTAIHELVEIDDALRGLIARDADLGDLRKRAIESGMISMRDDGIAKAKQGITTIEEVFRAIS